jgi:hypothetical protein
MDCAQVVESTIGELKGAFRCTPFDKGLCVVTPYLYPDNDLIELFVLELSVGRIRVTDFGETLRHLASQGIDVLGSPKRRFMFEQIAKRLHVQGVGGRLEKEGEPSEVGSVLLDVANAAHAVADLAYTSKAYEPAEFPDEVAALLRDNRIDHELRPRVRGMSGKEYRVGIRIDGVIRREILVEAMSPSQEAVMTAVVNRVVRQWVDIDSGRQKVSMLNDVDFRWRPEDVVLLARWSDVHTWSERESFIKFVREPPSERTGLR